MAIEALSRKISAENPTSLALSHPFLSLLTLGAIVCLLHRWGNGLTYSRTQAQDAPQERAMLPHWVPFIGHGPSFVLDNAKFLSDARQVVELRSNFALLLTWPKRTVGRQRVCGPVAWLQALHDRHAIT